MDILNADLVRKSEQEAVLKTGVSYLQLMERAGVSAAEKISERYDVKNKNIAVICGCGNNGGDGFVIAQSLYKKGANIKVFLPLGEPKTESAEHYFNLLSPIPVSNEFDGDFDIIIDAVFGIGLEREPSETLTALFEKINNSRATIISIDVPSGINCDTGLVYTKAVNADLTLTFIAKKPCFYLPYGSDFCGEVEVLDIGVVPVSYTYKAIEKPVFPKRQHNSHKGTYGTALLICGSYGMAGAAMLSAKAALRSGAGIVKCAIPKSIYYPFTAFLPEAVCLPLEEENGQLSYNFDIDKLSDKANALLFGCGIGVSDNCFLAFKNVIKNAKIPMVIDADGINLLSRSIELLKESKAPIIITPHPAEMARLCKKSVAEIEENRISIARDFAKKYGITVVLKGADTVVALENGEVFICTIGNPGMATAGSGDVLAGIIVSILAQGYPTDFAAKSGVYLHASAGDKAAKKRSQHALIATDIIEEL